MNKEFKIQDYFFFALLAGAIVLSVFMFLPFLTPLLLAGVVATIFFPLHRKISGVFSKGRTESYLSSLITMIVIVVLVMTPLTLVSVKISMEAKSVYDYYTVGGGQMPVIEQISQNIHNLVEKIIPGVNQTFVGSFDAREYIKQLSKTIFANIDSIFSSAAKIFFEFLIFILTLFYFLRDGSSLKRHLLKISPLNDKQDEDILNKMNKAVIVVIRGTLLVALIQGVLSGVGFSLTGIPNPALWGATAMIAALIPGFGTSLVLIPAVIYLFVTGHLLASFVLLIWASLAVGLIDNYLGPKLMSGGIGVHPLFILLAAVGGISLFGIVGFIVGPLLVSFVMVLISSYKFES